MPLTLRPTGLSRNPDANDWSIHEAGEEIGRLYEDPTATRPEITWFWFDYRDGAGTPPGENGRAGADLRGGQGAVCGKLGGVQGMTSSHLKV
jgi:hypothetical protein